MSNFYENSQRRLITGVFDTWEKVFNGFNDNTGDNVFNDVKDTGDKCMHWRKTSYPAFYLIACVIDTGDILSPVAATPAIKVMTTSAIIYRRCQIRSTCIEEKTENKKINVFGHRSMYVDPVKY
jgi:hypothetical protein